MASAAVTMYEGSLMPLILVQHQLPNCGSFFPDSLGSWKGCKVGVGLPLHMEIVHLLTCPAWLTALHQPWALPDGSHTEILGSWGFCAPLFLSCEPGDANGLVRRCSVGVSLCLCEEDAWL